jgi:hypothetical protein
MNEENILESLPSLVQPASKIVSDTQSLFENPSEISQIRVSSFVLKENKTSILNDTKSLPTESEYNTFNSPKSDTLTRFEKNKSLTSRNLGLITNESNLAKFKGVSTPVELLKGEILAKNELAVASRDSGFYSMDSLGLEPSTAKTDLNLHDTNLKDEFRLIHNSSEEYKDFDPELDEDESNAGESNFGTLPHVVIENASKEIRQIDELSSHDAIEKVAVTHDSFNNDGTESFLDEYFSEPHELVNNIEVPSTNYFTVSTISNLYN